MENVELCEVELCEVELCEDGENCWMCPTCDEVMFDMFEVGEIVKCDCCNERFILN